AVGGAANPDPSSGRNLCYAMGTLAVIVIIQRVFKGFLATVAVLAGLVIGTGVAFFLGDVNFDSVGGSAWFEVTTPFFFGIPKFSAAAIISMVVVMLITAVETTGDVFATGEIVEKRVGAEDVSRALRADGLSTLIGGVLNSFPYTCFAENVGLVRLTRVKSRYVVAAAGGFMILIGLIPKAGAIVANVPPPVLGGAALAMFATVAVVGIQTLARVDFHDHRNVVIVGTSLGLAVFVTVEPGVSQAVPDWAQIIFGSGITLGSLTAILLNLVFHHVGRNFGPAVAGTPGAGVIRLDQVNQMGREDFVQTFGRLFQGPVWVAERAYDQRPFKDTHDLRTAFQEALFSADRTEQRDLLSFYPDLGSDAVDGDNRGEESARDQGHVGLTLLNDEDHEEFAHLTEAYRDRFGIPLIVSVRDVEKRDEILKTGWERMQNAPTQEYAAAIIEVGKIANHRFDDLVADASPILGARAANLEAADPLSNPQPRTAIAGPTEGVKRFNALSDPAAREALASCLDVPRWVDEVAAQRPYDSAQSVLHRARLSAASFSDEEIAGALARHPRIGDRPGAEHDVEHSSREQAAVEGADPAVTAAIRTGNEEYENRFGRVFLIRAAGRPATEILS
ncbi:MAG: 2-oxo-4-hydroxy-4-carboxy-5-ureidoimidazoline decarboxylase, partial [Nakamurella sp.]